MWIFVKEKIPSYFFFLELSCSRAREPWQHAQNFLTSPHFKLLLSIVPYPPSKNDYFSSLFATSATTKYPTLYCIFFRKSKNQKKQKSSPRDKDEWCFDHKTLYLEKKQKKTKTIFWTVAAAPNYIMTSWKKSDSQMSHFRSLFFRVFVKVSLKVTLKTKQK